MSGSLRLLLHYYHLVIFIFSIDPSIGSILTSEDVSEGPCIIPPQPSIFPSNLLGNGTNGTFYVNIASKYFYYRFAELFLNRPAQSPEELDGMCLTLQYFPGEENNFNATTRGYRKTLNETCVILDGNHQFCNITNGTPGVNSTLYATGRHYILASDDKTYAFVYNCFLDSSGRESQNYKVISTTPSLSPEVMSKVEKLISSLGFNQSLVHKPSFNKCLPSIDVHQFGHGHGHEPTNNKGQSQSVLYNFVVPHVPLLVYSPPAPSHHPNLNFVPSVPEGHGSFVHLPLLRSLPGQLLLLQPHFVVPVIA